MDLRQRILLVDDDPEIGAFIARALEWIGVEAELACNGQIGVDHAMRSAAIGQPFDLILMDVQMPVMDGITATATLRKNGYRGKIVALTSMEEAREACLAAGSDEFVAKPITLDCLLDLVIRSTPIKRLSA